MIMQEFDNKRMTTNQPKINASSFDDVPIMVSARSSSLNQSLNVNVPSTSTIPQSKTSFDDIPIQVSKKRQGPFPYLKRKSIRVDLLLKKLKQQSKKKQSVKQVEKLRKEKKALEEENLILRGRLLQMEKLFADMNNFYSLKKVSAVLHKNLHKNQDSQTIQLKSQTVSCPKSNNNSLVECPKCHKCHKAKYMKYHQRICGNTQLKRLLTAKDLKRLEFIRLNQQTNSQTSLVNNWRKSRQQFLNQIKKDQKNRKINNICLVKRNFRK